MHFSYSFALVPPKCSYNDAGRSVSTRTSHPGISVGQGLRTAQSTQQSWSLQEALLAALGRQLSDMATHFSLRIYINQSQSASVSRRLVSRSFSAISSYQTILTLRVRCIGAATSVPSPVPSGSANRKAHLFTQTYAEDPSPPMRRIPGRYLCLNG